MTGMNCKFKGEDFVAIRFFFGKEEEIAHESYAIVHLPRETRMRIDLHNYEAVPVSMVISTPIFVLV